MFCLCEVHVFKRVRTCVRRRIANIRKIPELSLHSCSAQLFSAPLRIGFLSRSRQCHTLRPNCSAGGPLGLPVPHFAAKPVPLEVPMAHGGILPQELIFVQILVHIVYNFGTQDVLTLQPERLAGPRPGANNVKNMEQKFCQICGMPHRRK